MSRLVTVLCVALSTALCSPASARLSNTFEECVDRYGQPVSGPDEHSLHESTGARTIWKSYTFRARGVDIKVIFDGSSPTARVCEVVYRKSDGRDFNSDEVKTLLSRNAQQVWVQTKAKRVNVSRWQTNNAEEFAELDGNTTLSIWNKRWEDNVRERTNPSSTKEQAEKDFEGLRCPAKQGSHNVFTDTRWPRLVGVLFRSLLCLPARYLAADPGLHRGLLTGLSEIRVAEGLQLLIHTAGL